MAIVATDNTHYGNIAAAIREKNGLTAAYKPSEMAEAIRAIQTGGGENTVNGRKVISGTFTPAEDIVSYTIPDYHPDSYNRAGSFNVAFWLESDIPYDSKPFVYHGIIGKDYEGVKSRRGCSCYISDSGGSSCTSQAGTVSSNWSQKDNYISLGIGNGVPFKAGATYSWIVLELPK